MSKFLGNIGKRKATDHDRQRRETTPTGVRRRFRSCQNQPGASPVSRRDAFRGVLVVDDELELRGYTVVEAADGHTALDALAEPADAIDVVILDMAMPYSATELVSAIEHARARP